MDAEEAIALDDDFVDGAHLRSAHRVAHDRATHLDALDGLLDGNLLIERESGL